MQVMIVMKVVKCCALNEVIRIIRYNAYAVLICWVVDGGG